MANQFSLPGEGPEPRDATAEQLVARLPESARQVYIEAYRRALQLRAGLGGGVRRVVPLAESPARGLLRRRSW